MDQNSKVAAFRALHVKGTPLVLWNAWDAGSAKAVVDAGAQAVATGSWSVAAAQGHGDGEDLPIADALRVATQIAGAVECPVSVDFEGGYGTTPAEVARNVEQLIDTGVVGLNFEDRIVGGEGLHPVADQAAKIAAIRKVAEAKGVVFFINARTDVFFQDSKETNDALMAQALERAGSYAAAGADGLFVPGLADLGEIARMCAAQPLPVNVMRQGQDVADLAKAGVARISHGPAPYLSAMKAVQAAAAVFYG